MGWRVALADGNVVYVPQICGNISLLRHAAVAEAPVPPPHHSKKYVARAYYHPPTYTPAVAEQPVDMTPPPGAEAAPIDTAPTVAQAAPAAAVSHPIGALFFIPAAIVGGRGRHLARRREQLDANGFRRAPQARTPSSPARSKRFGDFRANGTDAVGAVFAS